MFGYMYTSGFQTFIYGGEIAQFREWKFDGSVDWPLLVNTHLGVQNLIKDLNALYRHEPALHQNQYKSEGFEWIDCNDVDSSVISFIRKS